MKKFRAHVSVGLYSAIYEGEAKYWTEFVDKCRNYCLNIINNAGSAAKYDYHQIGVDNLDNINTVNID